MCRYDIAERLTVVDHIVPGNRCASAFAWKGIQGEIGDKPRSVIELVNRRMVVDQISCKESRTSKDDVSGADRGGSVFMDVIDVRSFLRDAERQRSCLDVIR